MLRVSRRNAFVAAAGWVASSARGEGSLWRHGTAGSEPVSGAVALPLAGEDGGIFPLYRQLAAVLASPEEERRDALARALGPRHPALTAYGPALVEYLLDQIAGLGVSDAARAVSADPDSLTRRVQDGLARTRSLLEADHAPSVFLILSRRFDGRTDGRTIYFGVNRFDRERLHQQVALLTAHEYNHVVRAGHASFGTLLDAIVAEGLATACSEILEPGRPPWEYLLFQPAQWAWFTPRRLALLWADLRADPHSLSPVRRSRYLEGGCAGPRGAPPRCGYALGRLIVERWLERGTSIAALTRMPTAEIWRESGYAS